MELLITIQLVIIIALLVKNSYLYRESKDLKCEISEAKALIKELGEKLYKLNAYKKSLELLLGKIR